MARSDDYSRVLAGPLYTKIRQALYSTDETHEICQANELNGQEEGDCSEEQEHAPEIEEEEDKSVSSDKNIVKKTQYKNGKTRFCISPEVEQALGTLEKVISMVRKSRTENNTSISSDEEEEEEEDDASSPKQHSESTAVVSSSKVCTQDPKTEVVGEASLTHYNNNNSNR